MAIKYLRRLILENRSIFEKKSFSRIAFKSNFNRFLSQQEAIDVDVELFNEYGFSVDQLMELAGLSCASAISKTYKDDFYKSKSVLVVCGPGNNGGDGLVLSRHLKMFGYKPIVLYPRQGKGQLFDNLVKQCQKMEIEFLKDIHSVQWSEILIVVDALFGFSYKPPCRPYFLEILERLASLKNEIHKLVSIDIPSGWHVENGPIKSDPSIVLSPDCLISLTAPKLCAKYFSGKHHWIGGRFVPESLSQKYSLSLPNYYDEEQCVKIY